MAQITPIAKCPLCLCMTFFYGTHPKHTHNQMLKRSSRYVPPYLWSLVCTKIKCYKHYKKICLQLIFAIIIIYLKKKIVANDNSFLVKSHPITKITTYKCVHIYIYIYLPFTPIDKHKNYFLVWCVKNTKQNISKLGI